MLSSTPWNTQGKEKALQGGECELVTILNRLDLLIAGCSPVPCWGCTSELEGAQREKIGWQRIRRGVKCLLLRQEIAVSPRAWASAKGPPWPELVRAVLPHPA